MLKKSLKYIAVVLVNFIVLSILLTLWTDKFELLFNDWVRVFEFSKLIGLSIFGLIVLRFAVSVFRSLKIKNYKRKIGISTGLILVISGYFYVDYCTKIYYNRFVNSTLRNSVTKKVKPVEYGLSYGNQGEHLTAKEYEEIMKLKWFPKLPKHAENISYSYDYDGFLPDYDFSLSYDVPKEITIDTMHYEDGTFSKSRTFEVKGNKKRVTYHEGQW